MRGFRGSRAQQNQIGSRFGKPADYDHSQAPEAAQEAAPGAPSAQRFNLPDWMKTPETKALEAKLVREAPKPVQVTKPIVTAKAPPKLTVIQGGGGKSVTHGKQTVTAKHTAKPAVKVVAKAKAAPAKAKAVAKKAKPAARRKAA